MLSYTKTEIISLKNHPDFDEKWVGDRIAEDPSILGLGDLRLIDRERRQEKAGRLDLLLEDDDEEQRYEIELMLGATDESHVVRCIEYWDIERRRYPAYEHCAVLIAEDVTARFLNVISLIAGSVPLIAIQLTAIEVEGKVSLVPVKVLDARALLREDLEIAPTAKADRAQWADSRPKTLDVVDRCLSLMNEKSDKKFELNYTQAYIGLLDGNRPRVFITFWPRKIAAALEVVLGEDPESWVARLKADGMNAKAIGSEKLRVLVTQSDLDSQPKRETLTEFLSTAVQAYSKT
jgi:hypothetical protein